jgi:hypothetical protein
VLIPWTHRQNRVKKSSLALFSALIEAWELSIVSPEFSRILPDDFLFQPTPGEFESLRSQNATSKAGRGGRRYLPYAFTKHGVIMAATILNTPKAVEMSVFIVRAFVRLRELLLTHKQLASKLGELEQKVMSHDRDISMIINTIRQLMTPPVRKKRQIGFISKTDDEQ